MQPNLLTEMERTKFSQDRSIDVYPWHFEFWSTAPGGSINIKNVTCRSRTSNTGPKRSAGCYLMKGNPWHLHWTHCPESCCKGVQAVHMAELAGDRGNCACKYSDLCHSLPFKCGIMEFCASVYHSDVWQSAHVRHSLDATSCVDDRSLRDVIDLLPES